MDRGVTTLAFAIALTGCGAAADRGSSQETDGAADSGATSLSGSGTSSTQGATPSTSSSGGAEVTSEASTGTETPESSSGEAESSSSGGQPSTGWPDGSNTGVPPGIKLRPCSSDIVDPGVYDGCQFDGVVTLFTDDVTVRNSKIDGYVRSDVPDLDNVVFEDVEIDAHDELNYDALYIDGVTCTRCNVYNTRVCFRGEGITIEDSYCHDLHGVGDPATDGTHAETILASGERPIVIRHNNLVANWNDSSTGGGMSAVIAIYAGEFWGPLGAVTVENNRLQNTSGAFYCMYSGQDWMGATGMAVLDNVFVLEDPEYDMGCASPLYPDWVSDPINTWSGNTHEDGSVVPEP